MASGKTGSFTGQVTGRTTERKGDPERRKIDLPPPLTVKRGARHLAVGGRESLQWENQPSASRSIGCGSEQKNQKSWELSTRRTGKNSKTRRKPVNGGDTVLEQVFSPLKGSFSTERKHEARTIAQPRRRKRTLQARGVLALEKEEKNSNS